MIDDTESVRRDLVQRVNANAAERQALEASHGQVWDTAELQADFEVIGFAAPLVIAVEKTTGKRGSLFFQHRPRLYFGFQAD